MTDNGRPIPGRDIPIVKLVPRHQRQVARKYEERIAASLRAVGLIDPLIVFPQGENYEILDGNLRYRLLLDMGVESVPCLIGHEREGFTGNRMVNRLSPAQTVAVLKKGWIGFKQTFQQAIADGLKFVMDLFGLSVKDLVSAFAAIEKAWVRAHAEHDARRGRFIPANRRDFGSPRESSESSRMNKSSF